ncbi:hypothetical protein PS3A_18200 [Pseudomonas sp. 3A(2025)]
MQVRVVDQGGQLIWARSPIGGVTSLAYGADGTLKSIEQALELALTQCKGELATMNRDRVSDIRGSTT